MFFHNSKSFRADAVRNDDHFRVSKKRERKREKTKGYRGHEYSIEFKEYVFMSQAHM